MNHIPYTKHYKLLTALLLLTLAACQDPIEIDLKDQGETKLVVDGWMNKDEVAYLYLSYSLPYLQAGALPTATGALVTISDSTFTDTLVEQGSGTGYYINKTLKGELNKKYTLKIKTPDGKEYLSVNVIPRGITLDSIYFKPLPFGMQKDRFYTNYSFQETPGRGDFYWAQFYRNDTLLFEDHDLYGSATDDLFIDGQHLSDVGIGRTVRKGDKVKVCAYSITSDCYQFLYRLLANTAQQQNFTAPPPPTVVGNISSGALGFFRTSTKHELERVVQ